MGSVVTDAFVLSHKAPTANGGSYYYAFNHQGGGFVIVSGDDRTDAIIGYADEGSFNVNEIPDGMKDLLESYKMQFDNIDSDGVSPNTTTTTRQAIDPLIKTKWMKIILK